MTIDRALIVELTSKIAAAYVGNHAISVSELPHLVNIISDAISRAAGPEKNENSPALAPAVPIKKSVKPDSITCLECGKTLRTLKRHLDADHGLSVADYKAKWGLPSEYPVVAPNYAKARSELARKLGLGRKARVPAE